MHNLMKCTFWAAFLGCHQNMCPAKVRASIKKEGDGFQWGSDQGKGQREVPRWAAHSGEEDRGLRESCSKNKMDLLSHLMWATTSNSATKFGKN